MMLILTRRPKENLVITIDGRRIDVCILGLQGSQVKIGVKADPDVTIDREEIFNSKKGDKNVN